MIATNYLVSFMTSLLLMLSMAIISMEGSLVVSVEARSSLAQGVVATTRRLTTIATSTATDAPSSSNAGSSSSNSNAAAAASSSSSMHPTTTGGGVTRPSRASTVYPTMETIGSIASRTSSVKRATREPISAGMKFEIPKTSSESTTSNPSSPSSSSSSSSSFDSMTIDVINTSTTGSGGNDTISIDGNATDAKDDDFTAFGGSNGDGDDNTLHAIYSSAKDSTLLSNKPLTIPKEKKQSKQWPEIAAGIFVLGGFMFFFATCYRNNQRRRDYQPIPVALDV